MKYIEKNLCEFTTNQLCIDLPKEFKFFNKIEGKKGEYQLVLKVKDANHDDNLYDFFNKFPKDNLLNEFSNLVEKKLNSKASTLPYNLDDKISIIAKMLLDKKWMSEDEMEKMLLPNKQTETQEIFEAERHNM